MKAIALKAIALNGAVYHCPLSERFRRHTAEELELIRWSAEAVGVRHPVRVYFDTDLGLDNCVLDGEGRLTVCAEKGVTPEFRHEGRLSTDDAYRLALVDNDHRRQDSPEAVRKRRRERIERVAELRSDGKSLRAIAEAENVSLAQVRRDVADTGTVPPGTVVGLDGKTRPATRQAPPEDVAPEPHVLHNTQRHESESPPPVAADRPPPRPPEGPVIDPDHPHAKLLQAILNLAIRISTEVNDSPEGAKIRRYLLDIEFVRPRAKWVNGRTQRWFCVGLRSLYRAVCLAGKPGKMKPTDWVVNHCNEESE